MANTLPSYGILSMDLFPILKQKAAALTAYTTNFGAEIATKGTAITIGYQSPVSASIWTSAAPFSATDDETMSSVTVTMSEPYYVPFYLSPNELNSYGPGYLQKRMAAAAQGVLDEVKLKAQASLSGSIIASVSASAHNFASVLSASAVLLANGAQGQQTLMCPTNQYIALVSDAKNSNYSVTSTISNGTTKFNYNVLPTVDIVLDTSLSTPWIATQDAVALALRLPEQMAAYSRTIITDPDTNVSVAIDIFESPDTGKIKGRACVCAGVSTGRPKTAAKFTTP